MCKASGSEPAHGRCAGNDGALLTPVCLSSLGWDACAWSGTSGKEPLLRAQKGVLRSGRQGPYSTSAGADVSNTERSFAFSAQHAGGYSTTPSTSRSVALAGLRGRRGPACLGTSFKPGAASVTCRGPSLRVMTPRPSPGLTGAPCGDAGAFRVRSSVNGLSSF